MKKPIVIMNLCCIAEARLLQEEAHTSWRRLSLPSKSRRLVSAQRGALWRTGGSSLF